jgi:anti-anti-sigma factor
MGGTLNLVVSGELDAARAPELRSAILAASRDCDCLVIDLSDLRFIDSIGLSVLVGARKLSRKKGFELFVIPSTHEEVTGIFAVTGIEKALI